MPRSANADLRQARRFVVEDDRIHVRFVYVMRKALETEGVAVGDAPIAEDRLQLLGGGDERLEASLGMFDELGLQRLDRIAAPVEFLVPPDAERGLRRFARAFVIPIEQMPEIRPDLLGELGVALF